MPKVQTATINAVQITSRPRKDGTYPIVIRVQYGSRAEEYLQISVSQKDWNKKQQRVRTSNPNHIVYNKLIQKELQRIIDYRNRLEADSIPYTAKMLVDGEVKNLYNENTLDYLSLMCRMEKVKQLGLSACYLDQSVYKHLVEYVGRKSFDITILSGYYLEGFCKWLVTSRGIDVSSVPTICSRIGVLYHFGIDCGVIDEGKFPYPFKNFKYWKKYSNGSKRFGLSSEVMQLIENDFISKVCDVDVFSGEWKYKDEAVECLLNKRYSDLFIECLALLCYKMQGLAMVDLMQIKAENITIQNIEGFEYYIFSDLRRQKTNEGINVISVERNDVNRVIFDIFINSMADRDGWFLPLLNGKEDMLYSVNCNMRVLFKKKIGGILSSIDGISEMGFDLSKVTYYTFRHTFASVFANEKNGNIVHLAQLMGRSVSNISTYINQLKSVKDLIAAKRVMEG